MSVGTWTLHRYQYTLIYGEDDAQQADIMEKTVFCQKETTGVTPVASPGTPIA